MEKCFGSAWLLQKVFRTSDVVSCHVKALLNNDIPDRSIVIAVDEEVGKSIQLVVKLRKSLAGVWSF